MSKIFRMISILGALILLVGFGLCGALGVTAGIAEIDRTGSGGLFIVLGVVGLIIAFFCGLAVRKQIAKLRQPPSD